jgi:hypothetical protein
MILINISTQFGGKNNSFYKNNNKTSLNFLLNFY